MKPTQVIALFLSFIVKVESEKLVEHLVRYSILNPDRGESTFWRFWGCAPTVGIKTSKLPPACLLSFFLLLLLLCFVLSCLIMGKPTPRRTQERIKKLASEGKSTREIAKVLSVSQSTAARVGKKHRTSTPSTSNGRPRILDKQDEKYICRLATTGKCSTATTIQHELKSYAGITASPNTILRALQRHRIKSRYKKKCPQLSKSHRRARMAFERAHRSWQDDDWDKVIWSDETKICLFGSDGRERAFRKDGEPLRDH